MNTEQQRRGVTYKHEFDFTTQAEWVRPLGSGEGAIPAATPKREQQVFTAWKEELNWDERLLEAIADPGNLRKGIPEGEEKWRGCGSRWNEHR